jgi:hypothetical protein
LYLERSALLCGSAGSGSGVAGVCRKSNKCHDSYRSVFVMRASTAREDAKGGDTPPAPSRSCRCSRPSWSNRHSAGMSHTTTRGCDAALILLRAACVCRPRERDPTTYSRWFIVPCPALPCPALCTLCTVPHACIARAPGTVRTSCCI